MIINSVRIGVLVGILNTIFYFSNAQSDLNIDFKFKGKSYMTNIFKVDSQVLKGFKIVRNIDLLKHSEFINDYSNSVDSLNFVTNACISQPSGAPIGLLISLEHEVSSINLKDGNGNFYIKPNGILYVSNSNADICESNDFKVKDSYLAIQSGPMLVINKEIHPKFNPNSKNFNIRSGVGIYSNKLGQKYLVFSISNEPITFYEFAELFKENFNCLNAICLESAGCTFFTNQFGIKPVTEDIVVGNYLVHEKAKPKIKSIINLIKNTGGTYDIPVELNGVLKINFIFDSGASDVTVSPDVALTLIRAGTITRSDFVGTQKYVFANGDTATSQVFLLKEIKLGSHKLRKVRASISNSMDAPMLLGQSVLQRFGKISIDNTNHTLTIE